MKIKDKYHEAGLCVVFAALMAPGLWGAVDSGHRDLAWLLGGGIAVLLCYALRSLLRR